MTVLLFLAVLFVLILVHELGHLLAAKWAKMRVDEFAIGFPPRLFAVRKGETDYSLNLLPIGGYVSIYGENGQADQMDWGRAFSARPRHLQAIVLVAGVVMNILAAWLIFFAVGMIGTPTVVDSTVAGQSAELTVTTVLPGSPADEANIPLGAEITGARAGGEELNELTPESFIAFIVANQYTPTEVTYEHKGETNTVSLSPAAGVIESEPDRLAVGLSTAMVDIVREGPVTALMNATTRTYQTLIAIVIGISSLFASIFTLTADLSQVTGPVGIAGMVGDAAEFGLVPLLIFTAFISLNLAIINLLPIPALDGGRLIFVAIESIIRRPINPEWMMRVNFTGFALLILLMVAVTYNDIVRII